MSIGDKVRVLTTNPFWARRLGTVQEVSADEVRVVFSFVCDDGICYKYSTSLPRRDVAQPTQSAWLPGK